ncbi:hypothetical protein [Catenuloplanes japonicus]|uniref:hypothetical protein n=1 Tax=Catenuloplanes japonicus TaxID=33876 RepID=UPI0012F8F498|nr:hypothetical protein [Catenuloplanes japonicus]
MESVAEQLARDDKETWVAQQRARVLAADSAPPSVLRSQPKPARTAPAPHDTPDHGSGRSGSDHGGPSSEAARAFQARQAARGNPAALPGPELTGEPPAGVHGGYHRLGLRGLAEPDAPMPTRPAGTGDAGATPGTGGTRRSGRGPMTLADLDGHVASNGPRTRRGDGPVTIRDLLGDDGPATGRSWNPADGPMTFADLDTGAGSGRTPQRGSSPAPAVKPPKAGGADDMPGTGQLLGGEEFEIRAQRRKRFEPDPAAEPDAATKADAGTKTDAGTKAGTASTPGAKPHTTPVKPDPKPDTPPTFGPRDLMADYRVTRTSTGHVVTASETPTHTTVSYGDAPGWRQLTVGWDVSDLRVPQRVVGRLPESQRGNLMVEARLNQRYTAADGLSYADQVLVDQHGRPIEGRSVVRIPRALFDTLPVPGERIIPVDRNGNPTFAATADAFHFRPDNEFSRMPENQARPLGLREAEAGTRRYDIHNGWLVEESDGVLHFGRSDHRPSPVRTADEVLVNHAGLPTGDPFRATLPYGSGLPAEVHTVLRQIREGGARPFVAGEIGYRRAGADLPVAPQQQPVHQAGHAPDPQVTGGGHAPGHQATQVRGTQSRTMTELEYPSAHGPAPELGPWESAPAEHTRGLRTGHTLRTRGNEWVLSGPDGRYVPDPPRPPRAPADSVVLTVMPSVAGRPALAEFVAGLPADVQRRLLVRMYDPYDLTELRGIATAVLVRDDADGARVPIDGPAAVIVPVSQVPGWPVTGQTVIAYDVNGRPTFAAVGEMLHIRPAGSAWNMDPENRVTPLGLPAVPGTQSLDLGEKTWVQEAADQVHIGPEGESPVPRPDQIVVGKDGKPYEFAVITLPAGMDPQAPPVRNLLDRLNVGRETDLFGEEHIGWRVDVPSTVDDAGVHVPDGSTPAPTTTGTSTHAGAGAGTRTDAGSSSGVQPAAAAPVSPPRSRATAPDGGRLGTIAAELTRTKTALDAAQEEFDAATDEVDWAEAAPDGPAATRAARVVAINAARTRYNAASVALNVAQAARAFAVERERFSGAVAVEEATVREARAEALTRQDAVRARGDLPEGGARDAVVQAATASVLALRAAERELARVRARLAMAEAGALALRADRAVDAAENNVRKAEEALRQARAIPAGRTVTAPGGTTMTRDAAVRTATFDRDVALRRLGETQRIRDLAHARFRVAQDAVRNPRLPRPGRVIDPAVWTAAATEPVPAVPMARPDEGAATAHARAVADERRADTSVGAARTERKLAEAEIARVRLMPAGADRNAAAQRAAARRNAADGALEHAVEQRGHARGRKRAAKAVTDQQRVVDDARTAAIAADVAYREAAEAAAAEETPLAEGPVRDALVRDADRTRTVLHEAEDGLALLQDRLRMAEAEDTAARARHAARVARANARLTADAVKRAEELPENAPGRDDTVKQARKTDDLARLRAGEAARQAETAEARFGAARDRVERPPARRRDRPIVPDSWQRAHMLPVNLPTVPPLRRAGHRSPQEAKTQADRDVRTTTAVRDRAGIEHDAALKERKRAEALPPGDDRDRALGRAGHRVRVTTLLLHEARLALSHAEGRSAGAQQVIDRQTEADAARAEALRTRTEDADNPPPAAVARGIEATRQLRLAEGLLARAEANLAMAEADETAYLTGAAVERARANVRSTRAALQRAQAMPEDPPAATTAGTPAAQTPDAATPEAGTSATPTASTATKAPRQPGPKEKALKTATEDVQRATRELTAVLSRLDLTRGRGGVAHDQVANPRVTRPDRPLDPTTWTPADTVPVRIPSLHLDPATVQAHGRRAALVEDALRAGTSAEARTIAAAEAAAADTEIRTAEQQRIAVMRELRPDLSVAADWRTHLLLRRADARYLDALRDLRLAVWRSSHVEKRADLVQDVHDAQRDHDQARTAREEARAAFESAGSDDAARERLEQAYHTADEALVRAEVTRAAQEARLVLAHGADLDLQARQALIRAEANRRATLAALRSAMEMPRTPAAAEEARTTALTAATDADTLAARQLGEAQQAAHAAEVRFRLAQDSAQNPRVQRTERPFTGELIRPVRVDVPQVAPLRGEPGAASPEIEAGRALEDVARTKATLDRLTTALEAAKAALARAKEMPEASPDRAGAIRRAGVRSAAIATAVLEADRALTFARHRGAAAQTVLDARDEHDRAQAAHTLATDAFEAPDPRTDVEGEALYREMRAARRRWHESERELALAEAKLGRELAVETAALARRAVEAAESNVHLMRSRLRRAAPLPESETGPHPAAVALQDAETVLAAAVRARALAEPRARIAQDLVDNPRVRRTERPDAGEAMRPAPVDVPPVVSLAARPGSTLSPAEEETRARRDRSQADQALATLTAEHDRATEALRRAESLPDGEERTRAERRVQRLTRARHEVAWTASNAKARAEAATAVREAEQAGPGGEATLRRARAQLALTLAEETVLRARLAVSIGESNVDVTEAALRRARTGGSQEHITAATTARDRAVVDLAAAQRALSLAEPRLNLARDAVANPRVPRPRPADPDTWTPAAVEPVEILRVPPLHGTGITRATTPAVPPAPDPEMAALTAGLRAGYAMRRSTRRVLILSGDGPLMMTVGYLPEPPGTFWNLVVAPDVTDMNVVRDVIAALPAPVRARLIVDLPHNRVYTLAEVRALANALLVDPDRIRTQSQSALRLPPDRFATPPPASAHVIPVDAAGRPTFGALATAFHVRADTEFSGARENQRTPHGLTPRKDTRRLEVKGEGNWVAEESDRMVHVGQGDGSPLPTADQVLVDQAGDRLRTPVLFTLPYTGNNARLPQDVEALLGLINEGRETPIGRGDIGFRRLGSEVPKDPETPVTEDGPQLAPLQDAPELLTKGLRKGYSLRVRGRQMFLIAPGRYTTDPVPPPPVPPHFFNLVVDASVTDEAAVADLIAELPPNVRNRLVVDLPPGGSYDMRQIRGVADRILVQGKPGNRTPINGPSVVRLPASMFRDQPVAGRYIVPVDRHGRPTFGATADAFHIRSGLNPWSNEKRNQVTPLHLQVEPGTRRFTTEEGLAAEEHGGMVHIGPAGTPVVPSPEQTVVGRDGNRLTRPVRITLPDGTDVNAPAVRALLDRIDPALGDDDIGFRRDTSALPALPEPDADLRRLSAGLSDGYRLTKDGLRLHLSADGDDAPPLLLLPPPRNGFYQLMVGRGVDVAVIRELIAGLPDDVSRRLVVDLPIGYYTRADLRAIADYVLVDGRYRPIEGPSVVRVPVLMIDGRPGADRFLIPVDQNSLPTFGAVATAVHVRQSRSEWSRNPAHQRTPHRLDVTPRTRRFRTGDAWIAQEAGGMVHFGAESDGSPVPTTDQVLVDRDGNRLRGPVLITLPFGTEDVVPSVDELLEAISEGRHRALGTSDFGFRRARSEMPATLPEDDELSDSDEFSDSDSDSTWDRPDEDRHRAISGFGDRSPSRPRTPGTPSDTFEEPPAKPGTAVDALHEPAPDRAAQGSAPEIETDAVPDTTPAAVPTPAPETAPGHHDLPVIWQIRPAEAQGRSPRLPRGIDAGDGVMVLGDPGDRFRDQVRAAHRALTGAETPREIPLVVVGAGDHAIVARMLGGILEAYYELGVRPVIALDDRISADLFRNLIGDYQVPVIQRGRTSGGGLDNLGRSWTVQIPDAQIRTVVRHSAADALTAAVDAPPRDGVYGEVLSEELHLWLSLGDWPAKREFFRGHRGRLAFPRNENALRSMAMRRRPRILADGHGQVRELPPPVTTGIEAGVDAIGTHQAIMDLAVDGRAEMAFDYLTTTSAVNRISTIATEAIAHPESIPTLVALANGANDDVTHGANAAVLEALQVTLTAADGVPTTARNLILNNRMYLADGEHRTRWTRHLRDMSKDMPEKRKAQLSEIARLVMTCNDEPN